MSSRRTDLEIVAAAVVTAALVAAFAGHLDGAWVVGALVLAGAATAWWRDGRWVPAAVVSLAAGWLLVRVAVADANSGWIGVVGAVTVVAVTAGVGGARRSGLSSRVVLAALAVSCGGVWACVPETTDLVGRFTAVLGVGAALGAAVNARIGADLVGAAAAALVFMGVSGGQERASAVVGAVGCLGVLALAWTTPFLRRTRRRMRGLAGEAVALGGHGLGVLVASRVAGRGEGLVRPVLVALGVGVFLVAIMTTLEQEGHERR